VFEIMKVSLASERSARGTLVGREFDSDAVILPKA